MNSVHHNARGVRTYDIEGHQTQPSENIDIILSLLLSFNLPKENGRVSLKFRVEGIKVGSLKQGKKESSTCFDCTWFPKDKHVLNAIDVFIVIASG